MSAILWRRTSWAANSLLIGAAVLMSIFPAMALNYPVFVCFLLGHVIWVAYAMAKRNNEILILNAGMILIDAYAIVIRI